MVNATPRPLYLRERPGTLCIGGWVGSRAVLEGCGKISPLTGFRSPDRPARSESLYRLRCPCPQCKIIQPLNFYFCGLSDDVSTSDCTPSNVTIIDELEGISKETVVAECGYYRGICQKNVSETIKKKTLLG